MSPKPAAMNPTALLLLAASALGWVVPDDETAQQLYLAPQSSAQIDIQQMFNAFTERLESKLDELEGMTLLTALAREGAEEVEEAYLGVSNEQSEEGDEIGVIDQMYEEYLDQQVGEQEISDDLEYWDAEAWVKSFGMDVENGEVLETERHKSHDHGGKHGYDGDHHDHHPHDGDPPYSGPPAHRPHMPPRDHTSPHTNKTLWDLISSSKHTTRFASLLKNDASLYSLLSSKASNVTVFAPSNRAFSSLEKYLKKGHEGKDIPADVIHRVLSYHIANGTHSSQDLRYHNTIISRLPDDELGQGMDQRIRIGLNHKGPSLNFYSRFTMFDIFAQNGVIHGIDAVLLPPPDITTLIKLLPTVFSTSEAALRQTGLLDELPKLRGKGITLFLPPNCAWKKLGYRLNAFLFSPCGEKYLRAIMKYHIVVGSTLYSDALEIPTQTKAENEIDDPAGLIHGYVHVDLDTMLDGRHISADITRLERFLSFRVNGLNSIVVSDGLAKSGVIQVPDHVLIPPHSLDEHHTPPEAADGNGEDEEAEAEGMYSIEQLKSILESYVEEERGGEILWGVERAWEVEDQREGKDKIEGGEEEL